jgi:GT2 family glycosyltransferase
MMLLELPAIDTTWHLPTPPDDPSKTQAADRLTVLIPTYRRPTDLGRCIEALKLQFRPPDEVIVVVRDTDDMTRQFLRDFDHTTLPLRVVTVTKQGVVAAMNAGLAEATGDIVALTDDDAAPHPSWLARIERSFEKDASIAGVGGRDWIYQEGRRDNGIRNVVGKIQWFGRQVGNHHLGHGEARDVMVLKGVNCAYRATLLRRIGFDTRLLGEGAQMHWELSLGLSLKSAGYRLVYDPAICVDHFQSQRHDFDQRVALHFHFEAQRHVVHNQTLILMQHFGALRAIVFLMWAFAMGTVAGPGLLQLLRLLARRDRVAFHRWRATLAGHLSGIRAARQPVAVRTARQPAAMRAARRSAAVLIRPSY